MGGRGGGGMNRAKPDCISCENAKTCERQYIRRNAPKRGHQ